MGAASGAAGSSPAAPVAMSTLASNAPTPRITLVPAAGINVLFMIGPDVSCRSIMSLARRQRGPDRVHRGVHNDPHAELSQLRCGPARIAVHTVGGARLGFGVERTAAHE